jgi:hypothetical protein
MSIYPEHYGDNFIPIIFGGFLEHTSDHPFCWDERCPCHEDQDAISKVHQAYQDGLITAADATRIAQGRTI